MKIPSKIIAGGITYTIKQDNAPVNKETNTWGITQELDEEEIVNAVALYPIIKDNGLGFTI